MLKSPCEELVQAPPGFVAAEDSMSWLVEGFQALADATRLRIIHLLMARGETCVCQLMPLLGLTQSNISFHLKTLKHAGFIIPRKDRKWTHYSLNHKALEQFHTDFASMFRPSVWPQGTKPGCQEDATCREIECQ